MTTYQFMTPEWVEAAKKIRDEFNESESTVLPTTTLRMNLVVTGVPFGDGSTDAHIDTTDGTLKMDLGHLDGPELTVTLDYETAKAILIEQDPQAGTQAFMAGRIKADGDMMKLMAMQSSITTLVAAEAAAAIKEITD